MSKYASEIARIVKEYNSKQDDHLRSDDPMINLLLEAIFSKASELDDVFATAKEEIMDGVKDYMTNETKDQTPFFLASCYPKKDDYAVITDAYQYCINKAGDRLFLSSPASRFSIANLQLKFILCEDALRVVDSDEVISLSESVGRKYILGFECSSSLLEIKEKMTIYLGILPKDSYSQWFHRSSRYLEISSASKRLGHKKGWGLLLPPNGTNYLKYGTWAMESALIDHYEPYIYSLEITPNTISVQPPSTDRKLQRVLAKNTEYCWLELSFHHSEALPGLGAFDFHVNCIPFLNKGLEQDFNRPHNNGIIEIVGSPGESILGIHSIKKNNESIVDFDVQNSAKSGSKNIILNSKPQGHIDIEYWIMQKGADQKIKKQDKIIDYSAKECPLSSSSEVIHISKGSYTQKGNIQENEVLNKLFLSRNHLFSKEDIRAYIRDYLGRREIKVHFGYGTQYDPKNPMGLEPVIHLRIEADDKEQLSVDLRQLEAELNSRTSGIYPVVVQQVIEP